MHPEWREVYGSAGRAVSTLAALGARVTLHGYVDNAYIELLTGRGSFEGFISSATGTDHGVGFSYAHGLAVPRIDKPAQNRPTISLKAKKIVQFGMIEAEAVVHGDYVVYDPQNVENPTMFAANGSSAKHLAIVANRHEATEMIGRNGSPAQLAKALAKQSGAEVVILKLGPEGVFVLHEGRTAMLPAYQTDSVWKIGSGDVFVASFSFHWLHKKLSPVQAATAASKSTAYYCLTRGFPTPTQLASFAPKPICTSKKFMRGVRPQVYLAGPFFTLAQRWLIDQFRDNLLSMGLRVFSPYHDVGYGSAEQVVGLDLEAIHESDLLLAVGDGMDAGTVYEIGYARALKKPVVLYCENESEENKKMMQGSGCTMRNDFVSSVYATLWAAMSL